MHVYLVFYLIIGVITSLWIFREREWSIRKDYCNQRFQMLADSLSGTYCEMDTDGTIVLLAGLDWEPIFIREKQLFDKNILELFTEQSKERFNKALREVLSSHSPKRNIRLTFIDSTGSIGDISCSLFPINWFNGIPDRISAVFQNITKQVSLEQKMKENEQRYRSLFDYNPKAVFSFDLKGNFTTTNPVCEHYTGYSAKEFASLSFEDITLEEDLVKTKLHFEKALRGIPQNYETRIVCKNSEIIDVEVTNVPIMVDGIVTGVYGIADDITEYKKTEEFLRRSEKLTVVGELAAGIAHEIRNPLTPMKGFVQLLQESKSTSNKKYLDIILSEILRIETIINQYLSFARADISIYKDVDINELLNQVMQLLMPQATMCNITFSFDCLPDIPTITGDKDKLEQVFVNLVKNSIESMPSGGNIFIKVRLIALSQVSIQVIDHGNGIPEDRIPRLGEPFYTTKEKGTGLGLMTCYKIIGMHKGNIHIESKIGKGTTVTVSLPIKE